MTTSAKQPTAPLLASEGFNLTETGEVLPVVLDTLTGRALTDDLKAYVRRARRGVLDAALITGTGKDLVEAVAAHVLVQRFGTYSTSDNFPSLVGQAFVATGLCAVKKQQPTPQEQMDSVPSLASDVKRQIGERRPEPCVVCHAIH